MAARTRFQREKDLRELSELYLAGKKQDEIGERLKVTQSTISRDLKELQKRWLASSLRDFDAARAEELAKIDAQERKYHEHAKKLEGMAIAMYNTADFKTAARIMDTMLRYLNSVDDCIERRCKLLGLDAPQRLEHSGAAIINLTWPEAVTDGS